VESRVAQHADDVLAKLQQLPALFQACAHFSNARQAVFKKLGVNLADGEKFSQIIISCDQEGKFDQLSVFLKDVLHLSGEKLVNFFFELIRIFDIPMTSANQSSYLRIRGNTQLNYHMRAASAILSPSQGREFSDRLAREGVTDYGRSRQPKKGR